MATLSKRRTQPPTILKDELGAVRYLKITVPPGAQPGQQIVVTADLNSS
jgi:hypothetical protein